MGGRSQKGLVRVEDRPVLDSDVLIDYLRGAGPGRDLIRVLRSSLGYRVTSVSAFEIALGRSYAIDPRPANALLAVPCLSLSRSAALRAGALLHELRAGGSALEIRDAMQAGICVDAGTPLITRNRRHFERVGGLELVDPAEWLGRLH